MTTTAQRDQATADLQSAAARLLQSGRGRKALELLQEFLLNAGIGLDERNQDAVLTLLDGAWGGYVGTTRDAIAEALETDE